MKSNVTILISVIIIIATLILEFGFKRTKTDINNKHRPSKSKKPTQQKSNDKIVIVKYLQYDYLIKAIHQFCNLYNQEKFVALPRLIKHNYLSIIIFPYNIEFDKFCSFVNYMGNAHELSNKPDYQPNVKAWCTTLPVDRWIKDEIANKNIMLFIPESDSNLDKVYLTTKDNVGFKMGFLNDDLHFKAEKSMLKYEEIPININLLNKEKFIDFN